MSTEATLPVTPVDAPEPVQVITTADVAPINYDWGAIQMALRYEGDAGQPAEHRLRLCHAGQNES
jgi:hypothetical protein